MNKIILTIIKYILRLILIPLVFIYEYLIAIFGFKVNVKSFEFWWFNKRIDKKREDKDE